MSLSLSSIVIIGLLGYGAYASAKWLFKKDTEVEARRRAACQIAASLKEMGFKELPEFYMDYAVGDYSGMAYKLKNLAVKMASGEKAILAELDDVFTKLLSVKLGSKDGLVLVKSKLEEAEKLLMPIIEVEEEVAA